MSYKPEIHVLVEDKRWELVLPPIATWVEGWCRHACDHSPNGQALQRDLAELGVRLYVSVVLESDAAVQALNHDFRGRDKPTNVLSFRAYQDMREAAMSDPSIRGEGEILLGDIVLAYETVTAEAQAQGKTQHDHLAHLVMHGCLHLLGYDHEDEAEAEHMEALEIQLLAQVSIANPYEKR